MAGPHFGAYISCPIFDTLNIRSLLYSSMGTRYKLLYGDKPPTIICIMICMHTTFPGTPVHKNTF